jgi:hypothetical protein
LQTFRPTDYSQPTPTSRAGMIKTEIRQTIIKKYSISVTKFDIPNWANDQVASNECKSERIPFKKFPVLLT